MTQFGDTFTFYCQGCKVTFRVVTVTGSVSPRYCPYCASQSLSNGLQGVSGGRVGGRAQEVDEAAQRGFGEPSKQTPKVAGKPDPGESKKKDTSGSE